MRNQDAGLPPSFRANEVMSPTLPLPPPRDPGQLDVFLEWIASIPRNGRGEIREAIAQLRDREVVATLLHEALMSLPVGDPGRHLLVLAVLGELRAPSSIEVLERFVWLHDLEVYGEVQLAQLAPCDFSPSGALQARAAEMLVWVIGTDQDDKVLRIVREHPSTLVRVATIDAWLYQRGDSAEASSTLVGLVRPGDEWAVGLPRWTVDTDTQLFHRRVVEHATRFGDEVELPHKTGGQADVS